MTRLIALLSVAVLVAMLAFGPSMTGSTAVQAASTKVCKAKTPEGKTKTWRCSKDQACCVNQSLGTYVCGIPGLGCL